MRLPDLTLDQMTPRQHEVAVEAASGKRGRMPAPLRAWIHAPEMGAHAQRLGEVLRYDTTLGPILSEMAILMVARHWTSDYEWFVHKREALKAGLGPDVINSIAAYRHPEGMDDRQQVLFDYVKNCWKAARSASRPMPVPPRPLDSKAWSSSLDCWAITLWCQ